MPVWVREIRILGRQPNFVVASFVVCDDTEFPTINKYSQDVKTCLLPQGGQTDHVHIVGLPDAVKSSKLKALLRGFPMLTAGFSSPAIQRAKV